MSKLKKRLLALGLVFVMIVTIIPSSIYAENETTSSGTEAATTETTTTEETSGIEVETEASTEITSTESGTSTTEEATAETTESTTTTKEATTETTTTTEEVAETSSESGTSANLLGATLAATDSIQDIINDAEEGETVEITLSEDCTEDLEIIDGITVILDLNGYTLTSAGINKNAITVYGTLTIKDSSEDTKGEGNGTGTLEKGGTLTNTRGVIVAQGGSFIFESGTITGFSVSGNGGGVLVENGGTFAMTGGTITKNSATGFGGGVFLYDADQIEDMTGGTISDNEAGISGGGLAANTASNSTLTLDEGLTIDNNTAAKNGGGVYFNTALDTLTISSTIKNNKAESGMGGGVYFGASITTLNITDASIDGNTAGGAGGGCYFAVKVPSAAIESSSISYNTAAGNGGGLWFTSGTNLTFGTSTDDTSKINNNTIKASGNLYGGGIYLNSATGNKSTFTANGGEISENIVDSEDSSNSYGGGIYIASYATVTMTGTTFYKNTGATNGGAIYINDYAQADILLKDLKVSYNSADSSSTSNTGSGGGVYVTNSNQSTNYTVIISGGIYEYNTADYQGGGIYVSKRVTIQDAVEVSNNTAYQTGGGIRTETLIITGGDSSETAVKIHNNVTQTSYGAGAYATSSTSYALTATGYVEVYENEAKANAGGGLGVNAGGMYLDGTDGCISIHDNTATSGAGLYSYSSSAGTITLKGNVDICNNKTTSNGAGIYSAYHLEIYDGVKIHDNYSYGSGGGVCTRSIAMYGGEICNNSAASGGAIYDMAGLVDSAYVTDGASHISGGSIHDNIARTGAGGAIYSPYSTSASNILYVEGEAEIYNNTAGTNGGGLWIGDSLYFTGGSIHDNSATQRGGGVYVGGYRGQTADIEIAEDSTGVIYDNSSSIVNGGNDVALCTTLDSDYYVYKDTHSGKDYATLNLGAASTFYNSDKSIVGKSWYYEVGAKYITDEINNNSGTVYYTYTFIYKTEEGEVAEVYNKSTGEYEIFGSVQKAVDKIAAAEDGVYGTKDSVDDEITIIMLDDSREDVDITTGLTVTLDLNGKTLKGMEGSVITVEAGANLTIKDSTADETTGVGEGKITGGSGSVDAGVATYKYTVSTNVCGGGLIIYGTATLESGVITGNKAQWGAGIYVSQGGTFTMNSGSITGNTSGSGGGGVYARSNGYTSVSFTMNGGTISGNTAGNGAGAYIYNSAFNMTGGSITGNTSTGNGGGIICGSRVTINITGGEITGNKVTSTSNFGGGMYISNGSSTVTVGEGVKFYDNTAASKSGNDIYMIYTNGSISIADASKMPDSPYDSWYDAYGSDSSTTCPYYYYNTSVSFSDTLTESKTNGAFALTASKYPNEYVAYIPDDSSGTTIYQYDTGSKDEEGNTVYAYTTDESDLTGGYSASKTSKGTAYTTLQAAINAAGDSDTIYLLCDHAEDVDVTAKTVTIDLNGYTLYTVDSYGFKTTLTSSSGNNTNLTIKDTSTSDSTGDSWDAFHNKKSGAVGTLTPSEDNTNEFPRAIYSTANVNYPATITIDGVTITGYGDEDVTTSSTYSSTTYYGGAIYATNYNTITIKGYSVLSGNYANYGGAIYMSGISTYLTVDDNVEISGNEAYYGGGIYFTSSGSNTDTTKYYASLTIKNAKLTGNYAAYRGGAIYSSCTDAATNTHESERMKIILTGTEISGNSCGNGGGAAYLENIPTLTFDGCNVEGNTSENSYAGVFLNVRENIGPNSCITINNTDFKDNVASTSYGALAINYGKVSISGCGFTGNTAQSTMSALYLNCVLDDSKVESCTFANNTTITEGQVIYVLNSDVDFSDVTVEDNTNPATSSTMYVRGTNESYPTKVTLTGCTISDSTGYGLYTTLGTTTVNNVAVVGSVNVTLKSTTIENSTAYGIYLVADNANKDARNSLVVNIEDDTKICNSGYCGVYAAYGTLNMNGGEICGNNTTGTTTTGGGIWSVGSNINISGGSIYNNTSTKGGGIYLQENSTTYNYSSYKESTITGGSIYGNTSTSTGASGGGIYMTDYASLTMTGGSITGNTAAGLGGGVYMSSNCTSFVLEKDSDDKTGQIYDNTATLGQDVYASYSSGSANTVLQLVEAESMFEDDSGMTGIGWLNESTSAVTTTAIDYSPVKKIYPLTLEYETNTVVAVIWNKNEGKYDTFYSVQEAVDALLADKTGDNGNYYTGSITSPEIILVDDAVGNVEILGSQTLTINLNGYTLKGNTTAITCYGTLDIKDVQYSGTATPGDADNYCEHYDKLVLANQAAHDNNTYLGAGKGTSYTGTITGTAASNGGGIAVYSGGCVTMTSGQVADCSAGGTNTGSAYGGAGVYVENGTFILGGTASINNCSTLAYGAAVYITGTSATFTLQDSAEITDNSSRAGAVYLIGGTFKMTGGTISDNTATTYGGGIYMASGTAKISGGEITGNTADSRGGGIYLTNGTLTLSGSVKITDNAATTSSTTDVLSGAGGGIYMQSGTLNIKTGVEITGNTSIRGGGIYQYNGTINMSGGQITGNTAEYGGGLVQYPTQSGKFTMTGGVLCDNTSSLGSAGNDVYSVSESGSYTYTGTSYPTATLIRAADMDYTDEGYSASYNVWKDDTYDGVVRTGEHIGEGQYITAKITTSTGLMLTADKYKETAATVETTTTFYTNAISVSSIADGTSSYWDSNGVTAYKDAETGESTTDTWNYQSATNPLAATWTAGDDNGNHNGLVRTYDRISYKLNITYQDSDGTDEEAETILLYVEATLPLTTTEAEFYTSNLTDYTIEESDDGTYSTITGYLEVDAEAGNQDVTIGINVKGMNNGDLVEPTFKTWIDGNSSNEDDPKELTPTAITVSAAGVYDLTLLRNEQLAYTGYFDLSTGEETTKKAYEEAEAAGNNTTIVYGTMLGYGITLSMRNYNTAKGKMGMASPEGDIEFDLTLKGSLYIDGNVVTNINGDQVYAAPYVWAYKANENTETGSNLGNTEKNINMNWNDEDDTNSTTQYAYNAAPFNTGGNTTSCYSGGAWTATGAQPEDNDEETTVHFTVSGYTIDTTYDSTTPNAASDGTTDNFTGKSIKPFSAGYIQVIFPIDTDTVSGESGYLSVGMESIVSGLDISDSSGKVTGRDVSDETDGDLASIIAWYGTSEYKLYATGEQYYLNNYVTAQTGLYVSSGDGESLIKTNYFNTSSLGTLTSDKGTGTTSLGSVVYMGSDVTFSSNTYDTTDSTSVHYNAAYNAQTDNAIEYDYMTAMNLLQKFDADAYTPASTTLEVVNETYTLTSQTNDIKDGSENVIFRIKTSEAAASWSTTKTMSYTLTILYAAKPDGSNWKYSTYKGYKTPTPEMDETTEEDLIYFTTLQDLYNYFGDSDGDGVSDGVCVGILYEFRDCCIRSGKSISAMARLDVTNDFDAAGNTYCITNDARCWTTYRPVYKDAIDTTTNTSLSNLLFDFTWYGVDYDDSKNTGVKVYGTADGSLPESYTTAYKKYSSSSGGYTYDSSSKAKLETYNPGYVKTEYVNGWQDTTTPTHSGWYQGNTLLLYTMESSIDIDGNDYDAGSNVPKSTYKIGTERTASFVVTPKLTESSSVSNELVSNGTQATEVVITISLPNHLNYDENSITIDYSASACGYEEGELEWTIVYTKSDAAVGENGYGTATIVLTTSVTDISKVLPTIKYTCTIGDPTVADGHEDEVSNGETLTTTATINTAYEESGQISTYAKEDTYTISVIKSAGDNIWIVGSGLLELGESMEFDVYYKNGSDGYRSIEIGNVLPYNGDGRGTDFTGGYQVTELTLTFSSYETLKKFLENGVLVFDNKAKYSDVTKEMDTLMDELLANGYVLYKGTGAESELKTDISDKGVTPTSGCYTVDEIAYTITFDFTKLSTEFQEILTQLATDDSGIAFYAYLDNVAKGEIVEMAYTLSPSVTTGGVTSLIADKKGNVQTGQNTYAESVSYRVAGETTGSVTSVLKTVSNVNRVLSGIAWLDQDNDGFYSTGSESTDEILKGIDVYLYSATPTDAQEYYNDSTVTVNKDADDNITSCVQTISDGNGGSTTITLYPTTVTVSDGNGGTTEVTLYPAVSVEGNLYNAVVTDEDGAYSFEYLAPGTYWVVFKDDTDNGKDEYTVDDTGTTPIPFGNLSVTAISSAAATSTGAYNRASASYGSGESTSTSPASLVLGYISGIEMPEASSLTLASDNKYSLGNRNAGFYYRELSVQKVWEKLITGEEIDAGTSLSYTITGTSLGKDGTTGDSYTYENTYVLEQAANSTGATKGLVTATCTDAESSLDFEGIMVYGENTVSSSDSIPSGYTAIPSLTVSSEDDTDTGLSTVTWTLETIALQAKDNYGEITYDLTDVIETETVDNGTGGTTTRSLTGFVTETSCEEVQSSLTSASVITAKAVNTQVLYNLNLYKISENSTATDTLFLAGAEFTLYNDIACDDNDIVTLVTESAVDTSGFAGSYSSGTANICDSSYGLLSIGSLAAGTYYLKETTAPEGYLLNNSIWKIEITYDEAVSLTVPVITITQVVDKDGYEIANLSPFTIDSNNTTTGTLSTYYVEDESGNTTGSFDGTALTYTISFEMENYISYELPESGGSGSIWYMTVGIMLILLAVWMMIVRRKQRYRQ